jgi:CheY-like chemotaxis protein
MMPDLNGDEVLKVIKSDPDHRDIPVVMISAVFGDLPRRCPETDCVAGHMRFELRNVAANYPFEKP